MSERKPYPPEQDLRSGCKVSWYYYDSREDADACAKVAKHNARIALSEGYDFGYCGPGSVSWVESRQQWEVCIP